MRLRTMALSVAVVLGSMAMAGTSQAATPRTPHVTKTVSITEFMFTPSRISGLHVGDTVMWTNNGGVTHTTTAKGGVWDSGNLAPGASFSFTFTTSGIFKYRCQIHHQMTGGIQVLP